MKTIKEVAGTIKSFGKTSFNEEGVTTFEHEGKEISFREYLEGQSGNGIIYDDYIGDILNAAMYADESQWADVDDIIGPIAQEMLTEAVQTDQESFLEMVQELRIARERMKAKYEAHVAEEMADLEYIINEETPDLPHVVEGLIHALNSGMQIKESEFYSAGNTRIVVGYTDSK